MIRKTQFFATLRLFLELSYQISSLIKSNFFLVGVWGRQVNEMGSKQ